RGVTKTHPETQRRLKLEKARPLQFSLELCDYVVKIETLTRAGLGYFCGGFRRCRLRPPCGLCFWCRGLCGLGRCGGCLLLGDLLLIEVANDPRDVHARFVVRRNPVILLNAL